MFRDIYNSMIILSLNMIKHIIIKNNNKLNNTHRTWTQVLSTQLNTLNHLS